MLGIWQRAYVGKAAVKVKADMPVHVVGRDGIAAVGPALKRCGYLLAVYGDGHGSL